jgi:hypothetical protein
LKYRHGNDWLFVNARHERYVAQDISFDIKPLDLSPSHYSFFFRL